MKNILVAILIAIAFTSCAVRAGVSVSENSNTNNPKGATQTTGGSDAIQQQPDSVTVK